MTGDFLAAGRLWLLLVVAALAVGYVVAQRWGRRAAVRFTEADLLASVAPRRPGWRRHTVVAIQLLGLAAIVVAAARPVERSTERISSEGRIVLLFDVSLSMMATDVEPDRFVAAQEAAREFVEAVDDDVEVGLISFSGATAVEVSPTLDRADVERGIDRLELAEATAIGDALSLGTRVLDTGEDDGEDEGDPGAEPDADAADDERPPGVLVLLSDGETTVGRPTSVGAAEAAQAGIPVFTIAFGTEFGTVQDPETGDIIPVPVRPADLADVADLTGGAAFAAETGSELADAYDQIRDSLGETLGEEIETITELTWRWALGAFVLLAIGWALGLWWLRSML